MLPTPRLLIVLSLALSASIATSPSAQARQTPLTNAFTYQGRLTQAGAPVNGSVDLSLTLHDAPIDGSQIGSVLLLVAVPVVDGVFTIDLDFGPNAYNGEARWLSIGVANPSNNGNGPFSGLTPRQPLAATPFAHFARSASLINHTGVATLSNPSNNFTGSFIGAFAGQGSGLTNLNPANLSFGVANIDISGAAAFATQATTSLSAASAATADNVTGIVAVVNGGTGGNDPVSARLNLQAAQRGANGDITSLSALSTPIALAQGGHGATEAVGARAALGAAKSGVNNDITSLTGLTSALSIPQGGTGAISAAAARGNLGAAKSGANDDITSLSGLVSPWTLAQGGTGASTAAGALTALGGASLSAANTFSVGGHVINNNAAAAIPLIVRGAASQSADIQQWRNSAGGVLASVSASGVLTGNGSGLTNMSATNLASGAVPSARLTGSYSQILSLTNPLNQLFGDGTNITNLNAGNIANGQLNAARLPSGGTWTMAAPLTLNTTSPVIFGQVPTLPVTTRALAVPPVAFRAFNSTVSWVGSNMELYFQSPGVPASFVAPLLLPDGAIVTAIAMLFVDNDATLLASGRLVRNTSVVGAAPSTVQVGLTSTSVPAASPNIVSVSMPGLPLTVNNASESYVLEVFWTGPASAVNIKFVGARVTYTIDEPLP